MDPISYYKRVEHQDLPYIVPLVTSKACKFFGKVHLPTLIETCMVCVAGVTTEGEVVVFMALHDYPNLVGVPQESWQTWIYSVYDMTAMKGFNSLFIHYMVYNDRYSPDFLPGAMTAIYRDNPYIEYVGIFIPPRVSSPSTINIHFNKTEPKKDHSGKLHSFFINCRSAHVDKLALRRTTQNDEDPLKVMVTEGVDIIFPNCQGALSEVSVQKTVDRIIVVSKERDSNDLIVLTTAVSYTGLNTKFNLTSVNGFKIESPDDATTLTVNKELINIKPEAVKPGISEAPYKERFDSAWLDRVLVEETKPTHNLYYEEVVLLQGMLLEDVPFTKYSSDEHRSLSRRARHLKEKEEKVFTSDSPALELLKPPEIYTPLNTEETKPSFVYMGKGNAFAIEVFISGRPKERLETEYFDNIFKLGPKNKNFCIIVIPSLCTPPSFLSLFQKFEKLDPLYPYELYATHQLAHCGRMSVREAWPYDLEEVVAMTDMTLYAHRIQEDLFRAVFSDKSNYQAFVLVAHTITVGVAIVCQELRVDLLQTRFNLDDLMYFSLHKPDRHGLMKHLMISPMFFHYTRFFVKEIIRLTSFTSIYYTLYPKSVMKQETSFTWLSALNRWVAVSPRRLLTYSQDQLGRNMPDPSLLRGTDKPLSLYYLNSRYCHLNKVINMSDIVVEGRGDIALSFLEQLVFSERRSYYGFMNIKLVAPDGLATWSNQFDLFMRRAMPASVRYTKNYLDSISLGVWVEIHKGYITSINRQSRSIGINFSQELHYDYLFLFGGKRFLKPNINLSKSLDLRDCKVGQNGSELEDYYQEYPKNLLLINHSRDLEDVMDWVRENTRDDMKNDFIIVHGNVINAWSCLNLLLQFFHPTNIIFVETPKDTGHCVEIFNNPMIYEACVEKLKKAQVKIYSMYQFLSWELNDSHNIVKVFFSSRAGVIKLRCHTLFSFHPYGIHPHTVLKLNRSGITFDQQVVIDHQFKTNDKRIYAGGSLTKYSKRYYLDHLDHCYYNEIEVGSKVAKQFLKDIHNETEEILDEEDSFKNVGLMEELVEPICTSAVLPGDFNYLKIRAPGPEIPFEQLLQKKLISKIMVTGDVVDANGPGYFRIVLDHNGKVMEVTCYTAKEIHVNHMIRLYGKHEKMLNNLVWRYNACLITDFYSFFSESWAYIFFHDRFDLLMEEINLLFKLPINKNGLSILKIASELFKFFKWDMLRDAEKKFLMKILQDYGINSNIFCKLMQFLKYNERLLPMYLNTKNLAEHKSIYKHNQLLEGPLKEDKSKFTLKDVFFVDDLSSPEDDSSENEEEARIELNKYLRILSTPQEKNVLQKCGE